MIIQCPACQTKFSIDSTVVNAVSSPRFHCSRCDHLFRLEENFISGGTHEGERQAAQREVPTHKSGAEDSRPGEQLDLLPTLHDGESWTGLDDETEIHEEESWTDEDPAPPKTPTNESTYNFVVDHAFHSKQRYTNGNQNSLLDENLPLVSAKWPDTPSTKPHEADMREVLKPLQQRERLNLPTQRYSGMDQGWESPLRSAPDAAITPAEEPAEIHRSAELEHQAPQVAAELPQPVRRSKKGHYRRRRVGISDRYSAPSRTREPDEAESLPPWARSSYPFPVSSPPRLQPLFMTLSVPVFIAAFVLVTAVRIWNYPARFEKALSVIGYTAPQIAPVGLDLLNLSSGYHTLEDGREILEIRGELRNNTTKTLSGIMIEAQLFDEANFPVSTMLVKQDNKLATAAQLTALKLEALEDLQQESDREKHLRPNETIPVRLVFTGDTRTAKWFTTRVFSVKPL